MHLKTNQLTIHGIAVIALGLIAGLGLAVKVSGGLMLGPMGPDLYFDLPGTLAAWRGAHTGSILNGILLIAVDAALARVRPCAKQVRRLHWSGALTVWGNAVFYFGAIGAPNRALSIGPNLAGDASVGGIIGYIGASVAMIAVVIFLGQLWIVFRQRETQQMPNGDIENDGSAK